MKSRVGQLLVAVVLLVASAAVASEQSKRLYSRGLVEFHAKRYAAALQLFERAVAADAEDPYALYYRGVTRARLGDFSGAITDLRAVLAKAPLKQAALELGVALVESEQYAEAVPWLEQAQRVASLDARASLFLGIAQLRLGQKDVASRNFDRAVARDPDLSLSARYYRGVVSYQEGKWPQAEEDFSYVAGTSPDSAMGHEAAAFLENIRRAGRTAATVYGTFGFQYDSNVVLAPSNQDIKAGISRQADGRGTILLGGAYVPWRTDHTELSVGYEFYQSLHIHLVDFNIQDNRLHAQLVTDIGRFQFGLMGRYDYYLLKTSRFLQEVTGSPWLSIAEGDFGRTDLSYRIRWRDFLKRGFNGVRDAVNQAPGFRQYAYLGGAERYVWAGYQFDREEPRTQSELGNAFGYDGHQGEVGIGWGFPASVTAEASYAYRNEQYDLASKKEFSPAGDRRRDEEHDFTLVMREQLTEQLGVTAAYLGTINNSNTPAFDYDRHVGSLSLEVRFY